MSTGIAHFSLTSKHFSRITELNPCQLGWLALACSLAVFGAVAALPAATPQMGVDEIRPGMVGIGRTVFDGTQVEEFKANILGVLENVIGTHRNLILAKLEGGPLANTGVIAGMSGSPVYIDGRLIGAVSYALGSFSKEPIAGITPIAEMTDATALQRRRARRRARARRVPAHAREPDRGVPQGAQLEPAVRRRPERRASCSGVAAVAGIGGGQLGTLLRPIATPLVMSGFEPDLADMLGARVPRSGIRPDRRQRRRRPRRRDAVRRSAEAGRRGRRDARRRRPAARRAPAPSRTSTATASTRSATRCTTSGRPSSR